MSAEKPYLEGNYVRFYIEYYSTGGIIGQYSSELTGGKWNGAN